MPFVYKEEHKSGYIYSVKVLYLLGWDTVDFSNYSK